MHYNISIKPFLEYYIYALYIANKDYIIFKVNEQSAPLCLVASSMATLYY